MEYILIYFGIGLFFATSVWLQTRSKIQNKLIVSILILLLWPLAIVILSSEVIEDEEKAIQNDCKEEDCLKNKIANFLSAQQVEITNYERKRIEGVAKYGYDEVYLFSDSANFQDIIDKLWTLHVHPPHSLILKLEKLILNQACKISNRPYFGMKLSWNSLFAFNHKEL